jgi:alpha/beta hydrolase fold
VIEQGRSGMLAGFETAEVQTGETSIFVRWSGSGSPILLLHGFPQTHLMWRDVAPLLARRFTVVCADLRGYGRSGCPSPPRIMGRMQSDPWRRTWSSSWNSWAFLASRLLGTTVAVASPIAWPSTIPAGSSGLPFLIFCRRGSAARSGSRTRHLRGVSCRSDS